MRLTDESERVSERKRRGWFKCLKNVAEERERERERGGGRERERARELNRREREPENEVER